MSDILIRKSNAMSGKNLLLEVDTSRLSEGMEVKNYRALCELLGEDRKTGNAKKAQIKEWERHFSIQKVEGSQKMIITEIYELPKAKEDKRLDGVYAKSIELILLYELSQCKGYTAYFTKNQLWHILGMVNKNYKKLSSNELKNIDYCITDFEINHFYYRVNARLTTILNTALESLDRRWIISKTDEYMIVDSRGNRRKAEDIDRKNILTLKKRVARILGCEEEYEIFQKMKTVEFYKLLNYYYNYYFNWKYVYKQYKLIFNNDIVLAEIPKVEKELQRELLNCNIVNALNTGAKKKYSASKGHKFQLPDMYLKAQSILTEKLIRIDPHDLHDTGDEVRQGTVNEIAGDFELSETEMKELQTQMDALFGI